MSSALDIGQQIADYCRQGRNLDAVDSFYGKDIVSIEPESDPGSSAHRTEGIDAIRAKNEHWIKNNQVHSLSVEGPLPHGDRFILLFTLDFTPGVGPAAGKRIQMQEAGLYTVADGKVVHEEFFYSM